MGERRLRGRFWIEAGLSILSLLLAICTILVPQWIEVLFGVEPDEGSGSFEVLITVIAIAVTAVFALAARFEWRRSVLAGT